MNKDKVLELREAGLSYGEISKLLDMPRSSVISIVKRIVIKPYINVDAIRHFLFVSHPCCV